MPAILADQHCCPTCRRPFADAPSDEVDPLALLRAACDAMGIARTWDEHVSEQDAARLLRRSAQTLRNRRGLDRPLPFRRHGRRIEYALSDLTKWSENNVPDDGN